ncbi:hypothetical protein Tco_0585598 [Tanacetum coccineum]
MQADRQQQRDPNRDRRRTADKYRFSSREIRTEVDEEQHTNTDSAERSEQRQQHAADSDRQQQIQTQADIQQTADRTSQTISDAERGKTRRMQSHMKPT